MTRAFGLATGLLLSAACAVEHTQTDLVSLTSTDRTSLREAGEVAVVTYAAPALTYNGYVDQRALGIVAETGIQAPLDRVRERVVSRLAGPLGYPGVGRATPAMAADDGVEALRATATAPLVLDFRTRSWGLGNLRGGGEPRSDDPIYTHHFVRMRLVRLADAKILWQAVCGLRGYPGDGAAKLSDLLAARGLLLRQKLTAAADGCADELVGFFEGAD